MAFDATSFLLLAKEDVDGNTWYSYVTSDTIATVLGTGYFDSVANQIDVNDKIWITASDGLVLSNVSTVTNPVTIQGAVTPSSGTASVTLNTTLYGQTVTASTAIITTASVVTLYASTATIAIASVVSLYASTATITTASVVTLYASTATVTTASVVTLYASTATIATASVVTLYASTATIATVSAVSIYASTATVTTASVVTLYASTASIATISLTGGQLTFPATQVASSDANTLDDYEEGTFTPGFSFGGGTTGITYNNQAGIYTKIGRVVFFSARVTLTDNGSSTGVWLLTGLPFTSSAYYHSVALWMSGVFMSPANNEYPMAYVDPSSTTISFWEVENDATPAITQMTDPYTTNSTEVICTGHYTV